MALAASFVLLLSTACNPSSPSVSGTGSSDAARPNQTELYRTTQDKEGGMNQYSDTDPRRSTGSLDSKTKARVDQAKVNLKKAESPEEIVDEFKSGRSLDERTKNVLEPVGDAIQDLKQDVTAGTERGIKNLKSNTENAKQGIKSTADQAQDNAAQLGKDASRNVKNTTTQLRSNVDSAVDSAKDLGDRADNVFDRTSTQTTGKSLGTLQSTRQATPDLDNQDLLKRAKDNFDAATRNLGEFAEDSANGR
ncbi:MAG: hypothetical protein KME07_22090 [Pegethrix bostrychoides GSE-TBD4-15B]|uniref:Uncharacterized protein n=1 Tax=Pegethrix bostrychoides GSE-TBD4-15B TaxID=2839662 RepID=A0A951PEF3_9CYAN|nr:hypothetical protein [Pegethrix bostrychoides GSE-TBD4-15B]